MAGRGPDGGREAGWGTALRVHRIGCCLDGVGAGQWNGGEENCGDPSEETLGC